MSQQQSKAVGSRSLSGVIGRLKQRSASLSRVTRGMQSPAAGAPVSHAEITLTQTPVAAHARQSAAGMIKASDLHMGCVQIRHVVCS